MLLNVISCIVIVLFDYFILSKMPYILLKDYFTASEKISFNNFLILIFFIILLVCILLEFVIYRKTNKKQKITLTILKFIIFALAFILDFYFVKQTNNIIYLIYYFMSIIGLGIIFLSSSIYFLTPKLREHLKPKKDIFYLNSK